MGFGVWVFGGCFGVGVFDFVLLFKLECKVENYGFWLLLSLLVLCYCFVFCF